MNKYTISIKDWKEDRRNTLLGYATVEIEDWKLEIRGCTFHESGGRRWLSLPAKPYIKSDGNKEWAYIISFTDTFEYEKFKEDVLKEFNKFIEISKPAPDKIWFGPKPPWAV